MTSHKRSFAPQGENHITCSSLRCKIYRGDHLLKGAKRKQFACSEATSTANTSHATCILSTCGTLWRFEF